MSAKIYIMGKVGDVSENDDAYQYCCLKFKERALELEANGYVPVNPMELVPRGTDWNKAMKICLAAMLDCDGVSPLPDTWYSTGGMIEFNLSQRLQMPIVMPQFASVSEL